MLELTTTKNKLFVQTHANMSKTISVADDVYEWMKREKGERSFSELIRDLKKENPDLEEIAGLNVTSGSGMKKLEEEKEAASERTVEKFKKRFLE